MGWPVAQVDRRAIERNETKRLEFTAYCRQNFRRDQLIFLDESRHVRRPPWLVRGAWPPADTVHRTSGACPAHTAAPSASSAHVGPRSSSEAALSPSSPWSQPLACWTGTSWRGRLTRTSSWISSCAAWCVPGNTWRRVLRAQHLSRPLSWRPGCHIAGASAAALPRALQRGGH